MCQLLVMGNEETLGGFPVKSVVPALVRVPFSLNNKYVLWFDVNILNVPTFLTYDLFFYFYLFVQITLLQMEHNFDIVSIMNSSVQLPLLVFVWVVVLMLPCCCAYLLNCVHRWIMPPVLSHTWWRHCHGPLLWWWMLSLSSWRR